MDSIAFMILLQVVLIAVNAVFACAEIAVISFNDNKLAKMAEEGDKRAARLAKLTSQPARFLSTIQVAITLAGFMGSAFAAENFSDVLVHWVLSLGVKIPEATLDSIAVVVITIVLSYFTLVFGELVPKQVAMRKAEGLALGMSGLLAGVSVVFAPIVWFLTKSTNGILRLMGIDPNAQDDDVSEEEIRMLVDVGSEKGTIDDDEKEFIQNVFEFDDLSAYEISTHRRDMILLDVEEPMEVWNDIIFNNRNGRYPVCEGSADKILGILNAKDYFRLEEKSREAVMANAVFPAYFVPDGIKADVLFRNMKKEGHRMAILVDEYGGVSGLVTINDLVEQLVGELDDTEDAEEAAEIVKLEDSVWKIKGSAELEELEEVLDVKISCDDYDTFNGLVFHELGTIPEDGEKINLVIDNLDIQVKDVQNHQIECAIVKVLPKEEPEEEK